MKIAAAVLLALSAAVAANAPADKYFGRLKMSALRIRYEILQVKSRYDNHKLLPEDAQHLAAFTAEAYYDWAARYPLDSWLGSTGISLAKLYEELPGSQARNTAARALTFVSSHLKNTKYSKSAVAELAHLSVKQYPYWAVKMKAATRAPRASPHPSGSPGGSTAPSAGPSASSAPSPAARATASPAARPSGDRL